MPFPNSAHELETCVGRLHYTITAKSPRAIELTHKQLEKHGSVVSTAATDALVISIHSAD